MSGRYRQALAALTVLILAAGAASCSSGPAGNITVRALWFGTSADGAPVNGVTDVGIATTHAPDQDRFAIDTESAVAAGTGDAWNASAWSGAGVAMLTAGLDPAGRTVTIDVSEAIDGPSAGTLLAAGVLADLQGCVPAADVTVTGALLPDGTVAGVGGVPAKIRAAAAAGLDLVLIPPEDRVSTDPDGGESIDVVALGRQLGIRVETVPSMTAAYQRLCPEQAPVPDGPWAPLERRLTAVIGRGTSTALERLAGLPVARAAEAAPTAVADRRRVAALRQRALREAPTLLRRGNDIEAFALASLAARQTTAWNANMGARRRAADRPELTQARLLAAARRLERDVDRALHDAAATPPVTTEQFGQLPDALSWGTDALATTIATRRDLERPGLSLDEVGFAAADLAAARYDSTHVQPVAVAGVMTTGTAPALDPEAMRRVLAAYAEFLTDAADANARYAAFVATTQGSDPGLPDGRLAEILRERTQRAATGAAGGDEADLMLHASSALSYFVSSVSLVATKGLLAGGTGAEPQDLDRLQIIDTEAFGARSQVALDQARSVAASMSAAGLDPSYLRWGAQWGAFVATDSAEFPQQARREGLVYQWYAEIQARMTLALSRTGK